MRSATKLQTGYVYHYAYIILSGTVLFVIGSFWGMEHNALFVYLLTFLYIVRQHSAYVK
jgi:hypothetical protein